MTIPMGFDQCYLLKGEGCVLVDAGEPGKVGKLKKALGKAGIAPGQVGLVVLTHGHWDHIGSVRDIKELTSAEIAMHRSDARWLEDGEKPLPPGITPWGRSFMWVHRLFMPFIRILPVKVDILLDDAGMDLEPYGICGRVIHTPGHSYGSVSVLLDTGEAFVGDLAMNRLPLTLRPGKAIFGDDQDLMKDSLIKLAELGARKIFPAHGRPFGLEKLVRIKDVRTGNEEHFSEPEGEICG